MKRFYKFLMSAAMAMALMVPWTTRAQEFTCDNGSPVTLANADAATTTTTYIPGFSTYNYSYTEVIVLAENLEGMGDIYSMQFKPSSTSAGTYFTNCEIYLANTALETLSDGFSHDSTMQLVYSGSLNYTTTDWRTVVFDTVFHYTGGNLLVAVRRNHGSWTSGSTFSAYTAGAQLARYIYQDSGPYDPMTVGAGTATATVPLYRFTGCSVPVTCGRISDYTVSDIQPRSFVLSWSDALNTGATYNVISLPDSTALATGITDTFVLIENVVPESTHTYALYADCGGGDVSRYTNFIVTTPPACAVITNLQAVTTANTALLNWVPSVTDPECLGLVQYRLTDDTTAGWSEISSTTGTSYTLSGLAGGTAYQVRVAALCDNGDTSRWSNINIITKNLPCIVPDPDTANSSIVEFSTGTRTTTGVFVNSSWGNTVCQSIYTADELLEAGMHAGPIYGVTLGYSAAGSYTKEISIFMGSTTEETYANSSSMIQPSTMTHVYGPVVRPATAASAGWQYYEFDTVFVWDGVSNIVLTTFVNQSGSSQSSSGFYGWSTQDTATRTVYRYRDSNPYTYDGAPTEGSNGGTSSYRPSVSFRISGCLQSLNCAAPAIAVTSLSGTEVTLSWIPGADETSWSVDYRLAEDSVFTVLASNVTETSYTIQNLSPNTSYVFRVVNTCTDGDFPAMISVTTPCVAMTLPFAENFESFNTGSSAAFDSCWYKNSTYSSGYPYVSTSYAHSGTKGMYFYGYSATSATWLVLPTMALPVRNLELSFWEYKTSTTYGTVEIGVITDPTDLSTFTPVTTVTPTSTSVWQQFNINFLNYNGPDGRIAFVDRTSDGYSFYIDDIEVGRYSSCPRPQNITALHITHNSAQISWQAPDTNEHSYVVLWGTTNDVDAAIDSAVVTDGMAYTISGLTDSTQYYAWVYTTCSEEISSPVTTSFMTASACSPVENLRISNVTLNSAAATWDVPSVGNVPSGYNVVVNTPESTAPVLTTTTTNTYLFLSGLDTNTVYTVTVSPICGDATGVAAMVSFTTETPGTIGGNDGTGYTPTYPYYNYSISEQIWKAEELTGFGNAIDSIAFRAASDISNRRMQIYIGNTSLDNLSTTSFVPSDSMTLVFDGMYNIVSGWNWFPFNATFARAAGQNLVVMVVDSTGNYSSFDGWICGLSSVNSLYAYQDDAPYSTTDLSSLNTANYRPQMALGAVEVTVTCAVPSVVVAGVETTSIDIAWAGSYDSYSVEYRPINDTNWTVAATNLTGVNTYTINGLVASAQYYIRLTAFCGSNSASAVIPATTECGDIHVPYTEDFEDYSGTYFARPCWTVATTNSVVSETTYPYVSPLIGQGPSLRLYQGAYVALPHIAEPLNTLQLRFQYIASDTIYPMFFGYMTDPENINTLVVLETLRTNDETDVRNYTIQLNTLGDDVDGYLAFYTPVQDPQNYTFIDNLIVEEIPTCVIPDSLSVSDVTTTTATLSWIAGDGLTPTSFNVLYRKYGETAFDTVSTTNYGITLTGLDHSSYYEVAVYAVCSATDQSAVSPIVRFVTDCAPMALPYNENFDNYPVPATYATGVLPNCWSVIENISGDIAPQIYYGNGQSGAYSFRMYNLATAVLPKMDTSVDALQLSFHDYISSYNYGLVVGVLDSLTPNATFHPVDTIIVNASGQYDFTFYMAAAGVHDGYIALKNFNAGTGSYSYHYIDNVVVSLAPSCLPVTHISAILDSASSITLDWNDPLPATDWEISYSTTALADPSTGTVIPVTAHPYTVTGLSDANTYYFYIRNVCGAGDTSTWTVAGPYRCHAVSMRANQTDTLYMCGGVIYDDGGADGTYSNSQNSTIYLMPSDGSSLVSVSGYSYTEGSLDYLAIYDGLGTTGQILFRDNSSPNGQSFTDIMSSTGPLTLVFHTDGSVTYDGFYVNVSCIPDACPVSNIVLDTNTPLTTNTASIVWEGSSTSYQIEYGNAGFTLGTGTATTTTTNSFVMNNLESLHSYDFYVRGLCNVSDTGLWHKLTFSTPMCDNVNVVENFSGTSSVTSTYSPIGYSLYNYSYVQTIIDSADLASLTNGITAFAFDAGTITTGSDQFENMTVYLANVSESELTSGFIHPDSAHTFVKVIDNANFNFTESGWQIHGFDTTFFWDGHSNILMSVKRDNGDYSGSQTFAAHTATGNKTRYAYQDSGPFNINTITSSEGTNNSASTTVGNVRLISCGPACSAPTVTSVDTTYSSITVNWSNSDNTELAIMEGAWDETMVNTTVTAAPGTYTFTGLTDSTEYSIGLRQMCEDDMTSAWTVVTILTPVRPCFVPTNPSASDVTLTTATLSWTPGRNETAWDLHIMGEGYDQTFAVTTNPYTVTGLSYGVTYTFEVRANCDADVYSDWSTSATFTTLTCQPVTGVNVNPNTITANSAVVSWTAPQGATNFEIEYGMSGFNQGNGIIVAATGTSHTLTDLSSTTVYDVYVRTVCGEGVTSAWSSVVDFTTADGEGIDDVNSAAISLYPNPASSTVTLTGIEGAAMVTVVDMNGRETGKWTVVDGTLTIDVTEMAQGAYFVRIVGEQVNAIRKLIVR